MNRQEYTKSFADNNKAETKPSNQNEKLGFGDTVALIAGGSGGHVIAAMTVAEKLYSKGVGCILITDERGNHWIKDSNAYSTIIIDAASPYRTIAIKRAGGFAGIFSVFGRLINKIKARVNSFWRIYKSTKKSAKLLKEHNVKCAIGFGGYPSFPAAFGAYYLGIPLIVLEQNTVMGRANLSLVEYATKVLYGFTPKKGTKLPRDIGYEVVGNPVEKSVTSAAVLKYQPYEKDSEFRLTVFGGSQGSYALIETLAKAMSRIKKEVTPKIRLVVQCPKEHAAILEQSLNVAGIANLTISAFYDNLPEIIANSHLVISRGGAMSVASLAIIGTPAIIVPLPGAIDGDQYYNGALLASHNAALLVKQEDFTPSYLVNCLEDFISKPSKLNKMANNGSQVNQINADDRIANIVLDYAKKLPSNTSSKDSRAGKAFLLPSLTWCLIKAVGKVKK